MKGLTIKRKNLPSSYWVDLFHQVVEMSWKKFIFFYFVFFLTINFIFGYFYYWLEQYALTIGAKTFSEAYFFSVQTFSTVNFGKFSPLSPIANILVTIQIIFGLLTLALLAGIIFAKFSRPTAKVLFSKNILQTTINKKPFLVFRLANIRKNKILKANLTVNYLFKEVTSEGPAYTRFKPLKLERTFSPLFALSWTAFHPIDEDSPFYNLDSNEAEKLKFDLYVVLTGIDSTHGQNIHCSHNYQYDDFVIGGQFVDIISESKTGVKIIDYSEFHKIAISEEKIENTK